MGMPMIHPYFTMLVSMHTARLHLRPIHVGPLEQLEGLEQLRFLERGAHVLCVEVEAKGRQFWELNNPEDVPRIEMMLSQMGLA